MLVPLMAVLGACAGPGQPPAAGPVESVRVGTFTPSNHGFTFTNRFEGSPLPPSLRNDDSPLGVALRTAIEPRAPRRFGLCGGMSLAAADFYLAGESPAMTPIPPVDGSPMFAYLQRRQMDSFGRSSAMVLKFWQWMNLPDQSDDGPTPATLTRRDVPRILATLRSGRLLPIGLVYVKGAANNLAPASPTGDLWENHQVLAYGFDQFPDRLELLIYDPNFPRDDSLRIRIADADRATCFKRIDRTGREKAIRGFFVMPYTPVKPPTEICMRQEKKP